MNNDEKKAMLNDDLLDEVAGGYGSIFNEGMYYNDMVASIRMGWTMKEYIAATKKDYKNGVLGSISPYSEENWKILRKFIKSNWARAEAEANAMTAK